MSTAKWITAIENTANYRTFLAEQNIPILEKTKAYLFTRETLDKLLNQSAEGLDAVRVYIGQEVFEEGTAIRLYAVGAKKNEAGNYDDYNIPTEQNIINEEETTTELEEGNPCPTSCSSPNPLNGG